MDQPWIKMSPFVYSEKLEFIVTAKNWIQNGNTYSRCYQMYNGGIRVTFPDDQTLYGTSFIVQWYFQNWCVQTKPSGHFFLSKGHPKSYIENQL